jgi:hypothetical protein
MKTTFINVRSGSAVAILPSIVKLCRAARTFAENIATNSAARHTGVVAPAADDFQLWEI